MKMGDYEFELKRFRYLEARSEETVYFDAVLYVNGKKFAECGNNGKGGQTDVYICPESGSLGKEIEDFLNSQPKVKIAGSDYEYELSLDSIVDDLVHKKIEEKEQQRIRKMAKDSLVFQTPNGDYLKVQ